MQIIISAVISTAISFVILNFGEDIQDGITDTVKKFIAWLSEKCKKKGGDK